MMTIISIMMMVIGIAVAIAINMKGGQGGRRKLLVYTSDTLVTGMVIGDPPQTASSDQPESSFWETRFGHQCSGLMCT